MHDGDEVGLVLLAREEGMTLREAAELAGVPLSTAGAWACVSSSSFEQNVQ